ncbi:MoxR family ATPase [Methylomonas sp. MV1]|uniref:AAA family ATPase n=1 Tax=Methylomonas sp. MV1 TaxID=3073620 RepID=UPI0028A56678|nr:MoxR family ATPase [Methylomonas sp. MV1]MDT4329105.1 MoxR family ATPase [Methylomonas sp. MV1]
MAKQPKLSDFLPHQLKVSNPIHKLHHIFDEADCYALWAAYSAGRPLLVRGKPGTGKSQMARAIAEQLGWAFVSETIRGSSDLSDLHWHFDAIGRLGEAQALSMAGGDEQTNREKLDPLKFLSPGAFWWAYDWHSARQQYDKTATRPRPVPQIPQGKEWDAKTGGVVLLIDEIDKAEPDLPNGLLETLGQYQFTVPYIDHQNRQADVKNPIHADPARLLVIITTNEERELPKAFVRRCFVHTLRMEKSAEPVDPKAEASLPKRLDWLIQRGRLHFGEQIDDGVYRQTAELLWQDRESNPHTQYPPGLAEYIDLLTALQPLPKGEQQQRLKNISAYALQKDFVEER